jgi:LmbE family N-acetylglucosaminyl deacetylase
VNHVYLSPHLDDAVLSCGGAIYRHATAGTPVLVITIFSGEYTGDERSPFAQVQHDQWGNWSQIMALRRAEDRAALTLLGAEGCYLDHLDAVYRTDADGSWMYVDLETLFGKLHPGDPLARGGTIELADQIAGIIPRDDQQVVYAPLGAGHHVDHQIVHTAARHLLGKGYRVVFYEDYPYAEQPGVLESSLAAAEDGGGRIETIPLEPADLLAKVSALRYYGTQMATLFGGVEVMPNRVWAFAATRSPETALAERIWHPPAA